MQNSSVDILNGYTAFVKVGSDSPLSFPLTNDTQPYGFVANSQARVPLPISLLFSPVGAAGGQNISNGTRIATLYMRKYFRTPGGNEKRFTWRIFAANDVFIPTGGCNVSSRNINVDLPEYSQNSVPLDVRLYINCPSRMRNINYSLGVKNWNSVSNTFNNIATGSPAYGVGVQMLDVNNNPIVPNRDINVGDVDGDPVNIGLKANYKIIPGQSVTAGSVQSLIEVNFTYQ